MQHLPGEEREMRRMKEGKQLWIMGSLPWRSSQQISSPFLLKSSSGRAIPKAAKWRKESSALSEGRGAATPNSGIRGYLREVLRVSAVLRNSAPSFQFLSPWSAFAAFNLISLAESPCPVVLGIPLDHSGGLGHNRT